MAHRVYYLEPLFSEGLNLQLPYTGSLLTLPVELGLGLVNLTTISAPDASLSQRWPYLTYLVTRPYTSRVRGHPSRGEEALGEYLRSYALTRISPTLITPEFR